MGAAKETSCRAMLPSVISMEREERIQKYLRATRTKTAYSHFLRFARGPGMNFLFSA